MRLISCTLLIVALAGPAFGQQNNPLITISGIESAKTIPTALTSDVPAVTLDLHGFPGAAVQLSGTWTGTVVFEVSVDGANYQPAYFTPPNSTTPVTSTTGNGMWSGSVVGYRFLQARFASPSGGSPIVTLRATLGGGSGGGGGGAAAGSVTINDPTFAAQKANVNASGQLSVNCANCSGSGVSQQDNTGFAAGTTNFVPMGGVVDDVTTGTVTENSAGAARLTAQRGLHTNPRDGAGAELFGTAALAANGTANPTLGGLRSFAFVFNGATWDRWTGAVQAAQSGSWAVQANAGTGTFAISALALPLPAGASTLGEQQTQTTALQLIDNLPLTQGSSTAGQSGVLTQGAVTTLAPSYTAGQTNPLSLTPGGLLRVDNSGVTQPITGAITNTAFIANAGTNLNTSALALDATLTNRTQRTQLTDGTRDGTIKAASTAAAAADTALVVGLSPNSPLPAGGNTIGALSPNQSVNTAQMAGTATAVGNGASSAGTQRVTLASDSTGQVALAAGSSVRLTDGTDTANITGTSIDVNCTGGCGGAATFTDNSPFTFGSTSIGNTGYVVDDVASTTVTENSSGTPRMTSSRIAYADLSKSGSNTNSFKVDFGGSAQPISGTVTLGAGSAAIGSITNTGFNVNNFPTTATTAALAVRCVNAAGNAFESCAGSGSAGADVNIASIAGNSIITGVAELPVSLSSLPTVTIGTFPDNEPFNMAQVGGTATTTGQGVATAGTQRVTMSQEFTYSAGTAAKTATAAGTAPFFEICGSASKTIRLQRITISGTVATAAVWGDVILSKRSAASTGGTATTLTNVPYDTGNATAATATAKFYTVLPTAGALVGTIYAVTQLFPVTAISTTLQPTPVPILWTWRDQDAEAPTLRGTAQCVTAHFGTTTTNAPTLTVSVAWTEK